MGVYAQSVISGWVQNEKGEPLDFVRVTVLSPVDSCLLAYAFTNEKRLYDMTIKSSSSEILLVASGMLVERQTKRVKIQTRTINWVMREAVIALHEVEVKTRKVWGGKDTINYSVESKTAMTG